LLKEIRARRPVGGGATEAEMQISTSIKELSPHQLGLLGVEYVAYVKPVFVEGVAAFAVHAADGSQIAIVLTREAAFAAVRQHGMAPMSVH
jgi:hypothetical protein